MPQGTASGRARGIRLLPYDAQTKGEIVNRFFPLRDPGDGVDQVVVVVWQPFWQPADPRAARRDDAPGYGGLTPMRSGCSRIWPGRSTSS
jgi:hypothetical protein